MNFVLQGADRFLVSVSRAEFGSILKALHEVCSNPHIADAEFETRFGVTRESLQQLQSTISQHWHSAPDGWVQDVSAWADAASVQVRAITVSGDPVDMGSDEARDFANLLNDSITQAES